MYNRFFEKLLDLLQESADMMADCVEIILKIIHFNQVEKWIKKEILGRTEHLFDPVQIKHRNKKGVFICRHLGGSSTN